MGKPIDVSLFATNVTKREYYTFCFGLGGFSGSNGFDTCQVGAPTLFRRASQDTLSLIYHPPVPDISVPFPSEGV